MFDYDLVVIGSGPAGHRGAVQAARLRKRVALVERGETVGGVCVNTGTIPSKTMREALMYLSGYREHLTYGVSYTVKQKITMKDLMFRVGPVVRHEIDVIRHQLQRNGVELLTAEASFVDPHTLELRFADGHSQGLISGDKILIASGSEATRDPHIPFDGRCIFSSDAFSLSLRPARATICKGVAMSRRAWCNFSTVKSGQHSSLTYSSA